MENNEKLCPITRDICIEDGCAWWSTYTDQCSITAIGDGMIREMEKLGHSFQGISSGSAQEMP